MLRSLKGEADDEESVIRLRGLPYGCSKEEIANFFSGTQLFLIILLVSQDLVSGRLARAVGTGSRAGLVSGYVHTTVGLPLVCLCMGWFWLAGGLRAVGGGQA